MALATSDKDDKVCCVFAISQMLCFLWGLSHFLVTILQVGAVIILMSELRKPRHREVR